MKFFLIIFFSIFLSKTLNAEDTESYDEDKREGFEDKIYICKPYQFTSNHLSIISVGDDYQINILDGRDTTLGPNGNEIKSNIINGKFLSQLPEKYQKFYNEELINKLYTRLYFPDDKIVLQNKAKQTFEYKNTSYLFNKITRPILGFRVFDEKYAFDWDKEEKSSTSQFNFHQSQLRGSLGSHINVNVRYDNSLNVRIHAFVGKILGIELYTGGGYSSFNILESKCNEDVF